MTLKKILWTALIVRGLWIVLVAQLGSTASSWTPDTVSYVRPALSLIENGSFATDGVFEIFRTPGYPLFLIPGLLIGGVKGMTAIVIGMQFVLSLLTVWWVHRLALRITGDQAVSRLAALLYAFEPLSLFYTTFILSETLFACLLVGALERYLAFEQRFRMGSLLQAGALLTLAIMVRPIAMFLPLVLAALLALRLFFLAWPVRRIVFAVLLLSGLPWLVMAGWKLRNEAVTGVNALTTNDITILYHWYAPATLNHATGQSLDHIQKQFASQLESRLPENTYQRVLYEQARRDIALEVIRQYPLSFLLTYTKGLMMTCLDPSATDALKLVNAYPRQNGALKMLTEKGIVHLLVTLLDTRPLLMALSLVLGGLLLLVWLLSLKGLWLLKGRAFLLVLVLGCLLALSGGGNATGRFRHPVMPLLVILAAAGIQSRRVSAGLK